MGWELCARNLRVGRYEVDLLVVEGRTAVIVEVRTRGASSFTSAIGSIDAGKRQRLRSAAARIWRQWFRDRPEIDHLRFDVAAVHFSPDHEPTIEYVRAAFV